VALEHELADATVGDLAGRTRRRELSPVDVLEVTSAAIEADNDRRTSCVRRPTGPAPHA
jgi:hypothetical protein